MLPGAPPAAPTPDLATLADEATRLGMRADECRDPDDKFLPDLAAIGGWARRAAGRARRRRDGSPLIRGGRELKIPLRPEAATGPTSPD